MDCAIVSGLMRRGVGGYCHELCKVVFCLYFALFKNINRTLAKTTPQFAFIITHLLSGISGNIYLFFQFISLTRVYCIRMNTSTVVVKKAAQCVEKLSVFIRNHCYSVIRFNISRNSLHARLNVSQSAFMQTQ